MASKTLRQKAMAYVVSRSTYRTVKYREAHAFTFTSYILENWFITNKVILTIPSKRIDELWELYDKESSDTL